MTIIAHGNITVAGFHPSIVMFSHDMTIGTSRGVVCQIGSSSSLDEGIRSDSSSQTNQGSHGNGSRELPIHTLSSKKSITRVNVGPPEQASGPLPFKQRRREVKRCVCKVQEPSAFAQMEVTDYAAMYS